LFLVEGDSAGGSCKQARDRRYHAILPLRGKILNTERIPVTKVLSNVEVKAIVAAIGGGMGADFKVEQMRYGGVAMLSVDRAETVVLRDSDGEVHLRPIGAFVDQILNENCSDDRINQWQVACFSLECKQTKFAPIKKVIRHAEWGNLYNIRTRYSRSVKVTGSHSVFLYENGKVFLKPASAIEPGDFVVAPKRMPCLEQQHPELDLIRMLRSVGKTQGLMLRGPDIRQIAAARSLTSTLAATRPDRRELINRLWTEPRVSLDDVDWQKLRQARQNAGLTLCPIS
jgi:DNA gyrase subunit B